jgi:glycosyltransferase involved in cell wall biosynthesis
MSPATVSCIVPVFNGERYLREALDSILAQSYREVEVVAVDDGSTDGTRSVVGMYGRQVRYVAQRNAGPAAARNTGIAASRGGLIAFLDADDLWHPDKVRLQVDRFEARQELDVCVTHIRNFWMPELREEEERLRDHFRARPLPGYSSVTMMVRRRLFDRIGSFSPELLHGADAEWFARAEDAGAVFEVLPQVLVDRRLHAASRSRQWADRSRDEFIHTMKTLVDRRRLRRDR